MWDIESCHCVGTIPPHRLANAYPTANTPAYLRTPTTGSDQLPWLWAIRAASAL